MVVSTDPSLTGGGSRHRAGDRIPERSGNQNRAFIFVGTLLRWSMIPFPVLYFPSSRIHFLFVYLDIVLPVVFVLAPECRDIETALYDRTYVRTSLAYCVQYFSTS